MSRATNEHLGITVSLVLKTQQWIKLPKDERRKDIANN